MEHVRDVAGNVFGSCGEQQDAELAAHKVLQDGVEMGARKGVQAGERIIENEQAHGVRKSAGQMDSLSFTVGERNEVAVEQWMEMEQGRGLLPAPLECPPGIVVAESDFERIDFHHPVVRKKVADEQGAFLFDAIPARLDYAAVQVGFAVLEGDVGYRFFVTEAGGRPEMVMEFTANERKAGAKSVGEQRFSRTIRANDGPMFILPEHPGGIGKNEPVTDPENSVHKGQKGAR